MRPAAPPEAAPLEAAPGVRTRFELPDHLVASAPPEARGLARDGVRLLVARGHGHLEHTRFRTLGEHLRPGDVVVFNTSATMPAAIDGRRHDGRAVTVHVGGPHPSSHEQWVVELRRPDASGPQRDGLPGEMVALTGGGELTLSAPHPDPDATDSRLWRAALRGGSLTSLLAAHGRPVTYGYVTDRWPLETYTTVFARPATGFASAEMPSAARPFTPELVVDLATRGIQFAPVELHTGLSSPEVGEPPEPERFRVSDTTARLVTQARRAGGRVVAVGTTVARALETLAAPAGDLRAGEGWTQLVLGPRRGVRVVDGLLTGWHAPEASHLALLEAVAGPALVERAYHAALDAGYRWHELGDSCLLLP